MSEIVYLAAPYTDSDPLVMDMRFNWINQYVAECSNRGEVIFSPISMMHPVAKEHGLPRDWGFWGKFDEEFLRVCKKMRVLCLPGWITSVGVKEEEKLAASLEKPIEYESTWVAENVLFVRRSQ